MQALIGDTNKQTNKQIAHACMCDVSFVDCVHPMVYIQCLCNFLCPDSSCSSGALALCINQMSAQAMDILPFSHASTTSPHNGWQPQSWSWVYYMGFCYVVECLNDETQIQSVFQLLAHANGLSSGFFLFANEEGGAHEREGE